MWKPLLVCLVLSLPTACTSPEEDRGAGLAPTYGGVLSYPLDVTWTAVRPALANLGAADVVLDEGQRTATARIGTVDVRLELRSHTSGGTIVRVGAQEDGTERRDVGNAVLNSLQQLLL